MNLIDREIMPAVLKKMQPNKVVVISGARRTGKTILLKEIIKVIGQPCLLLNGEDFNTSLLLSTKSVENYRQLIGSREYLFIDEAQKVADIGNILKLMVDELPGLRIVVTGSSAFDLGNLTGEPLTGRKHTFSLFPLSEREFRQTESIIDQPDTLKQRLVFGCYPELVNLADVSDKKDYLADLINSYLLKDILVYEGIRQSGKIFNLLRLLAWQTGNEISYNELGKSLSLSKNTVEKYLDLLSKVFVIHKLEGFSRNLRKEVTKSPKWYFYDNGIRNALIASFQPVEMRNDIGQLWENYLICERIKLQHFLHTGTNNFFWRTYDRQEIDWIEESNGNIHGYELKWSDTRTKAPIAWRNAYPEAGFTVINKENYSKWLS
ncbi:MAG TPA: ATPase [Bacteroidales bacterium]|nr:ATPase [Bacteroidales bacterium]